MNEEKIKVQENGDSSLNQSAGNDQVESSSELIQQKEDQLRKLQEELNKKNEELDALKDLLVRRQADFENFKKRVIRLQEEDRKLAIKDIARDYHQYQ
jgi:molecular chaperone GrpE